jgi:AcrR family transcriptional regulator
MDLRGAVWSVRLRAHRWYCSGMVIPQEAPWAAVFPDKAWTALSADARRERILCAAGRVFSSDGLDAPMPAVAAAAGAGVASVYRRFPSKRDLLAALVTRRLEQIRAAAIEAAAAPADRWTALTELLRTVVEGQRGDDFLGDAYRQVSEHPDVVTAFEHTCRSLDVLVAGARDEGRLRPDASVDDLWLVFSATRSARELDPAGFVRMLELLIDGLERRHS